MLQGQQIEERIVFRGTVRSGSLDASGERAASGAGRFALLDPRPLSGNRPGEASRCDGPRPTRRLFHVEHFPWFCRTTSRGRPKVRPRIGLGHTPAQGSALPLLLRVGKSLWHQAGRSVRPDYVSSVESPTGCSPWNALRYGSGPSLAAHGSAQSLELRHARSRLPFSESSTENSLGRALGRSGSFGSARDWPSKLGAGTRSGTFRARYLLRSADPAPGAPLSHFTYLVSPSPRPLAAGARRARQIAAAGDNSRVASPASSSETTWNNSMEE